MAEEHRRALQLGFVKPDRSFDREPDDLRRQDQRRARGQADHTSRRRRTFARMDRDVLGPLPHRKAGLVYRCAWKQPLRPLFS